jgi:IS5 family transposase
MSQTRKGNQWYFGMKVHIGVDDQSGLVHTVTGTTARDSDMSQFAQLLHGQEERVSADRGYDYPQVHAHLQVHLMEDWVARKSKPNQKLDTWTRRFNHTVASIRAIGEHPFRILKRQFAIPKYAIAASTRTLRNSTRCLRWVTCFRSGERYWQCGRNPPSDGRFPVNQPIQHHNSHFCCSSGAEKLRNSNLTKCKALEF